jgi:E3 ubiquitin-protein ligase RAD18
MFWNANLDRAPAQRKSASELRADVKRWEDEQARLATRGKPGVPEANAHEKANQAEFARLVAQARPAKVASKMSGSEVEIVS